MGLETVVIFLVVYLSLFGIAIRQWTKDFGDVTIGAMLFLFIFGWVVGWAVTILRLIKPITSKVLWKRKQ